MNAKFLLQGVVIGFSIAAPVGPIGILCIRRTLANGQRAGFISGLGAATADAVYGCIAGFGLTALSTLLVQQQVWLGLVGGFYLCYLGIPTFLATPSLEMDTAPTKGAIAKDLFQHYRSTFFLTLTNPVTIFAFTAIFAGLGLVSSNGSYSSAMLLVFGVFLGSAGWWLLLSGGIGMVRSRITSAQLQWVNRISGLLLTAFGLFALFKPFLR